MATNAETAGTPDGDAADDDGDAGDRRGPGGPRPREGRARPVARPDRGASQDGHPRLLAAARPGPGPGRVSRKPGPAGEAGSRFAPVAGAAVADSLDVFRRPADVLR